MDFEGSAVFGCFLGCCRAGIEGLRAVAPDSCFLLAHEGNVRGRDEKSGGARGGAPAGRGGVGGIVGAAAMHMVLVLGLLHVRGVLIARQAVGGGSLGGEASV